MTLLDMCLTKSIIASRSIKPANARANVAPKSNQVNPRAFRFDMNSVRSLFFRFFAKCIKQPSGNGGFSEGQFCG
eukprot:2861358-Amphidinium_carterae.1